MRRTGWTELQSGVMWHGHIEDLARLVYCLAAHCTCGRPTLTGTIQWQCSAHRMLEDQHTLDHLAFARGVRQQIIASEWLVFWEPDEAPEPSGIGRLDLVLSPPTDLSPLPRKPVPQRRQVRRGARALAFALAALLVTFGLSGPLLSRTATAPPIAGWSSR